MKISKCLPLALLFALMGSVGFVKAQSSAALLYMQSIGKPLDSVARLSWAYISTMAHTDDLAGAQKKLEKTLAAIKSGQKIISSLGPFEGDVTFRDSALSYLAFGYKVMAEDFAQVDQLKANAELSFAAMQSYMNAADAANARLNTMVKFLEREQKKFAEKHNIKLVDINGKLHQDIKQATRVYSWRNKVYLLFFKSAKQEDLLIMALDKGDVAAINQNKAILQKFAEDALLRLDTMQPFDGDVALLNAAKDALRFFMSEAKDKVPLLMDYYTKKDKAERIKKNLDAIEEEKQTQQQIDTYNKAIEEMNLQVKIYNATNQELNAKREQVINAWNKASDTFIDVHVPKGK